MVNRETMQDEADLVNAAQHGKTAAFSELYRRHYKRVARRLSHLVGPQGSPEDLLQETFLKAMRSLSGFRSESSFATWILSIATRVARDEQRRKSRTLWRLFSDPETIDEAATCAPQSDTYAELRTVHRALHRLSPRLRELVILFDLEGETLMEIATQLDIPLHTAASRLRRGRTKLRHLLERSGTAALAERSKEDPTNKR